MPRKTKEQKDLEIETKQVKESNSNTKKKATTANKKTTTKKSTSTTTTAKKSTSKKTTTRKTTTKKSTAKKTTAKKTTRKTSTKKIADKKPEIVEYYDLPYRYNQTVVKVLAQTPTTLFVYWDISDSDREKFKKQYGENFFETTKPILIIYNDTMGYSFEIEINDFANSWYIHVSDSKCNYRIELGRRPIQKNEIINTDYIYVSSSNEIESPNDKILFDENQKMLYFRNVKTGIQTQKEVKNISLLRNMGKIYNIYDLYKTMYKNENVEEIFDFLNPSS